MLKILDVTFSYGSILALNKVSFEVREGEVVSLIGPNGSGKTTLLRCIARILRPKHGVVFINGKSVWSYRPKDLAQIVAYVPQIEGNSYPLTVLEVILLGRIPHMGISPTPKDLEVVHKVIRELGLEDLASRRINELSGGEWKKVVLARALAQEPKVLLLDEPTNHLDLKHQLEILHLIRGLSKFKRITIIMAMHDINTALRFSDKVIALKQGKIIFCGSPREISKRDIEGLYGVCVKIFKDENGIPIILPYRPIEQEEYLT